MTALKHKDGLLNTKIAARSHLMDIAKRNATESPLLRLPAEIRNMIWEYTVGGHQIDLHGHHKGSKSPYKSILHITPLSSETAFVTPTFWLPQVCRQIYVESACMIYTLNVFGFNNVDAMERWVKKLPLGWMRAVTSIDVLSYMRFYLANQRQPFHRKFPGIKHLRIDERCPSLMEEFSERDENSRQCVLDSIYERESKEVQVGWHAGAIHRARDSWCIPWRIDGGSGR